jgi:hypothetical protein
MFGGRVAGLGRAKTVKTGFPWQSTDSGSWFIWIKRHAIHAIWHVRWIRIARS